MTAATLVDVIEIGFLFYAANRDDPPPFFPSHTHTQTQRWFLQDLTITRGAFNQSGMRLGGASDGMGGGRGVITPSQSFSPFLLLPLSPPHFCFFAWSIPCDFSHRLFKQPPLLASLSFSSCFLPSLLVLHV